MNLVEVRVLNDKGAKAFREVWSEAPNRDPPMHILHDPEYTEVVTFRDGSTRQIDADAEFTTGKELAELIEDALGIEMDEARELPDMWSWLALLYYLQLRNGEMGDWPTSKGDMKTGGASPEKFIFDQDAGAFRYYRHRVFSKYFLWKQYGEDAMAFLCTPANQWSDVSEQILGGSMHMISSEPIIGAATLLYYDEASGSNKVGSGGSGPGSPRRFRDIFWQFNETYSIRRMTKEQIVQLLPPEFSRFTEEE